MSLLLLSLLGSTADASLCLLESDLTLELRELASAAPPLLDYLLGTNASAAEQELGEALEALMVVVEEGDPVLIQRFGDIVLSQLTGELDAELQEQVQAIVDSLVEADSISERETAFLAAAEDLGFEPLATYEPLPPVTPKPATETVVMVDPDKAGPTYSGLMDAETPVHEVSNDYDGGYEAGLSGLFLVMGQPGKYSNDFFQGYAAGQDEAWERR